MEKASMEGTQGLGAEGSEASLSLCGVQKRHLCVDSQGCLRTHSAFHKRRTEA